MENKYFWSWFTGFWEGEGHITLQNRGVLMGIRQVDIRPLEFIQKNIGIKTQIYEETPKNPNANISHKLIISRYKSAIEAIEKMLPYLVFRKSEVIQKLEIIKKRVHTSHNTTWDENEEKLLKNNYLKRTDEEVATILGRSKTSVKLHRYQCMKLVKSKKVSQRLRFKKNKKGDIREGSYLKMSLLPSGIIT